MIESALRREVARTHELLLRAAEHGGGAKATTDAAFAQVGQSVIPLLLRWVSQ